MGFEKAKMNLTHVRIGFFGKTGTGKTYTAIAVAIGLHKYIKSKNPIRFFDTESGSDWAAKLCAEAGIKLDTWHTRTFTDLVTTMHDTVGKSDILVVDSLTHVWGDLRDSYKRKKNTNILTVAAIGRLKDKWNSKFTDVYKTVPFHIIWCSREGMVFQMIPDEDEEGKTKMAATGAKPSTEMEAGYEPALLVQMVHARNVTDGTYIPRAIVVKDKNMDRQTTLMGKQFDWPTFENFLPHLRQLNLGGEHRPMNLDKDSQSEFDKDGRTDRDWARIERDGALEEFKNTLSGLFGTSKDDKRMKNKVAQILFGTTAWPKIEANHQNQYPVSRCKIAAAAVVALERACENAEFASSLTLETLTEYLEKQIAEEKKTEQEVPF